MAVDSIQPNISVPVVSLKLKSASGFISLKSKAVLLGGIFIEIIAIFDLLGQWVSFYSKSSTEPTKGFFECLKESSQERTLFKNLNFFI